MDPTTPGAPKVYFMPVDPTRYREEHLTPDNCWIWVVMGEKSYIFLLREDNPTPDNVVTMFIQSSFYRKDQRWLPALCWLMDVHAWVEATQNCND